MTNRSLSSIPLFSIAWSGIQIYLVCFIKKPSVRYFSIGFHLQSHVSSVIPSLFHSCRSHCRGVASGPQASRGAEVYLSLSCLHFKILANYPYMFYPIVIFVPHDYSVSPIWCWLTILQDTPLILLQHRIKNHIEFVGDINRTVRNL